MLASSVAALQDAVAATESLRRRVSAFQSRANLILAVLSPFVLWDIHTALLLQLWWARWHDKVVGWLAGLGTIEALSALATYASEHPDDVWPELVDGPLVFEAEALGHPLIDAEKCIRNDVTLPGPGTALLVTGSNMSGKSTLLRSVGLNVVLALAGLPVRARRLRVSRTRPATVMRVTDSLQEGASFFLAELMRLKSVVDLADAGQPVLFLLDEILQGTNSRERSLGARGVIAHLLDAGVFGLVSTHDLSLVQLGDQFRDRLRSAHFSDQVENGKMTFDYQLRPGVVQTTNALRLMQAIGLRVAVPPE
jgi:DNA mismatch repair ATPase MutS